MPLVAERSSAERGSDWRALWELPEAVMRSSHPGHPAEEYTMTKNIRFPMMSYAAIMAAMLAKSFTGPAGMMRRTRRVRDSIMDRRIRCRASLEFQRKVRHSRTCIKSIIADSLPRASDRDPHLEESTTSSPSKLPRSVSPRASGARNTRAIRSRNIQRTRRQRSQLLLSHGDCDCGSADRAQPSSRRRNTTIAGSLI